MKIEGLFEILDRYFLEVPFSMALVKLQELEETSEERDT